MKKEYLIIIFIEVITFCACSNEFLDNNTQKNSRGNLKKFKNIITIDSAYTYHGDLLYNTWLESYNKKMLNLKTRAMSSEDYSFFNKKFIIKSSEATLLYGKNYIYPGAIFEGNSLITQKYCPLFIQNRNPITLSTTLNHNTPKHTSQIITNPCLSKFSDYVKDIVKDGNFDQTEKFMFQYKRFTFYDEIKSAFGTNIDTRKLFSSRKEHSTENKEKIVKSTGMYVKFFQSSFTVNMDIAPLCNQIIKGKTNYEPAYVNSVTFGRLGFIVLETDETFEFSERCIKKEFSRIFYHKTITLSDKEKLFLNNTEFKILIIGADSDYSVQTIKGYSHFLNLISESKFTPTDYGVPITCSFANANTHDMVEIEFENTLYIEPLYVQIKKENIKHEGSYENNYLNSSKDFYIYFYKDREKTKQAIPYTDIIFNVIENETTIHYFPDYNQWPDIIEEYNIKHNNITIRNIAFNSKIYVGSEIIHYESSGKAPSGSPYESSYVWEANKLIKMYSLKDSPFYLKIN